MRPIRARVRTMLIAAAALALFAVAVLVPGSRVTGDPLLVADLRGQSLIVLDPSRPEDVRRIALPGGPHELARLPDGRIVVSLEQSGALALVDVATGATQVVYVGGMPHGLAIEGSILLVTDRSRDAVRRFEITEWSELSPLAVEAWPHAVAVGASGEIVVASAAAGILAIGDDHHHTGSVTETVAVAPDGRVATASAYEGTVTVFDRDGVLLATYGVGGRPVRVAFAPDGESLAVALSAAHAVAIIEDGRVETVDVDGVPDGLAYSRDGQTLFASDVYGGRVTAVSLDERAVQAVMRVGISTGALLVLDR